MLLASSYELPELYDLRTQHVTQDAEFYPKLFPTQSAPLVEIGCGTARLLEPLAKAGYSRLTGIDLSSAMLKRAADKLEGQSVKLCQLDVTAPWGAAELAQVGPTDGVMISFNFLHGVGPLPAQRLCLENCRRILSPGGRVVVHTSMPPYFRRGDRKIENKQIGRYVDARGRVIEHWVSLECDFVDQTVEGRATYRVQNEGGEPEVYEVPMRIWLTKPEQLVLLAEVCGYRVLERWGGYDQSAYAAGSEHHIALLAAV